MLILFAIAVAFLFIVLLIFGLKTLLLIFKFELILLAIGLIIKEIKELFR